MKLDESIADEWNAMNINALQEDAIDMHVPSVQTLAG
jgi:hypothetical protein